MKDLNKNEIIEQQLLSNEERLFLEECINQRMQEIVIPDIEKIRTAYQKLQQYISAVTQFNQHMFAGHVVAVCSNLTLEKLEDFMDTSMELLIRHSSELEITQKILEASHACLDKLEENLKRAEAVTEVSKEFIASLAE